jgi:hypothetical protein
MLIRSICFGIILILVSVSGVLAQDGKDSGKQKSKGSSKIVTRYDKSADVTTVRMKQMTISTLKNEKDVGNTVALHQMDLSASFSYPGATPPKEVDSVTLVFHAVGSNYIFLTPQKIIVALDRETPGKDRAFSLGVTDYKSTAPKFNSVYEEFMSIKAPPSVLEKLANANSVEIYVGISGYKLTPEQQSQIGSLAAQLPKL